MQSIAAAKSDNIQKHFRVVLLEPKDSLNVGSVARAMMNFGFEDLVLIRPRDIDLDLSKRTARKASSILDKAKIFETEQQALSDCTSVLGFSTKFSKNTPPVICLHEWAEALSQTGLNLADKTALLFGPEDTGLRYDNLVVCNFLVRIPSCDQYDSLNLAQAAMLVFYEIAKDKISINLEPLEPLADAAHFLALDDLIQQLAEKSEFQHAGTPHNTMNLLKNLFRRPNLSVREMQVLMGLFSRLNKIN